MTKSVTSINSVGVILAAGKGTRFKSQGVNKTAALFKNKPLIRYGLQLYKGLVDQVAIVVGAYADSVKNAVGIDESVIYAPQTKRLGTGHALKVAVKAIKEANLEPQFILVGYGDHMMYYRKQFIRGFISLHKSTNSAISFITTVHDDPNAIAWGRIIRNAQTNAVVKNVEQKDATPEELLVNELNAGFYCIDYKFLKKHVNRLTKSPVTGEYYLPELIEIAIANNLPVSGYQVPFNYVGMGINTKNDLQESQRYYSHIERKPVQV